MPNHRIEVIGKDFPALTPIRYAKERSTGGKVQVEAKCKLCGRTRLVLPTQLATLKSCGCIQTKTAIENAKAANAAHREELRKHKRKELDGEFWLVTLAACKLLRIYKATLYTWKGSCKWLDGAGIRTRTIAGWHGQESEYFSEVDLKKIKDARTKTAFVPKVEGHIYLVEALKRLRLSRETMRTRLEKLGEEIVVHWAKGSDGRPCKRRYITVVAFDAIKKQPRNLKSMQPAPNRTLVTRQDAAKILKCSISLIDKFLREGQLAYEDGVFLDREAVKRLANVRRGSIDDVVDAQVVHDKLDRVHATVEASVIATKNGVEKLHGQADANKAEVIGTIGLKKQEDADATTIFSLGNEEYRIGSGKALKVKEKEDWLLNAFIGRNAMTTEEIAAKSGIEKNDVPATVRDLRKNYDGQFANAVTTPGKKNSGGYKAKVVKAL